MLAMINKYLVAILGTTVVGMGLVIGVLSWMLHSERAEVTRLTTELGTVAAMSKEQEVKVVESQKIEERIKVVAQDKIHVITEYVYDENKSDCDNAIDVMRTVF